MGRNILTLAKTRPDRDDVEIRISRHLLICKNICKSRSRYRWAEIDKQTDIHTDR